MPIREVNNINPKRTESRLFTEILRSHTQTGIYYLNLVHSKANPLVGSRTCLVVGLVCVTLASKFEPPFFLLLCVDSMVQAAEFEPPSTVRYCVCARKMVRGRGFEPLKACASSSTPQDAFSGPNRRILSVAPLVRVLPL